MTEDLCVSCRWGYISLADMGPAGMSSLGNRWDQSDERFLVQLYVEPLNTTVLLQYYYSTTTTLQMI